MEELKAFGANEEITKIRREAGIVIESEVMTPISENYLTNLPNGVVRQSLTHLKVPRSHKPMKRRFGTTP